MYAGHTLPWNNPVAEDTVLDNPKLLGELFNVCDSSDNSQDKITAGHSFVRSVRDYVFAKYESAKTSAKDASIVVAQKMQPMVELVKNNPKKSVIVAAVTALTLYAAYKLYEATIPETDSEVEEDIDDALEVGFIEKDRSYLKDVFKLKPLKSTNIMGPLFSLDSTGNYIQSLRGLSLDLLKNPHFVSQPTRQSSNKRGWILSATVFGYAAIEKLFQSDAVQKTHGIKIKYSLFAQQKKF